jgi:glycine cleavage system transcriptional repressor
MTETHRVVSAVGADRPGLVNEISTALREAGANLEDSRMAILGGEFALIVLVGGSAQVMARVDALAPSLGERLGLGVHVRPTQGASAPRDYLAYRIRVSGLDHPGIVQTVTAVLAERHVNVASLDTRLAHAPLSGTPTFLLDAELQLPPSVALPELRRALAEVCERENLDLSLEARR